MRLGSLKTAIILWAGQAIMLLTRLLNLLNYFTLIKQAGLKNGSIIGRL